MITGVYIFWIHLIQIINQSWYEQQINFKNHIIDLSKSSIRINRYVLKRWGPEVLPLVHVTAFPDGPSSVGNPKWSADTTVFGGLATRKSHLDVPRHPNQFVFVWVLLLRATMLGQRYELFWTQHSQPVLVTHSTYLTSLRVFTLW